ncbi:hypothetical protein DOT_5165 [Desulfosporosinus sp. OT]|nr:hypothetical protein DOT_5165 [Desulfosporosinus sp. OT]
MQHIGATNVIFPKLKQVEIEGYELNQKILKRNKEITCFYWLSLYFMLFIH